MPLSKTHSPDDIYDYRQQALDLLCEEHPNYDEIKELLEEQVQEDLDDYANSFPVSDT